MKKWIAMLGLLIACNTAPEFNYPAKQFNPPSHYADWWTEVAVCAGEEFKPVRYSLIDFYSVPVDSFTVATRNGRVTTVAATANWDIFLAAWVKDSGRIVRHEMVHVATGHRTHSSVFYKCKTMRGQ